MQTNDPVSHQPLASSSARAYPTRPTARAPHSDPGRGNHPTPQLPRPRGAIVAVDYSLSPEAQFPTAIEEVHAAGRWVRVHAAGNGWDPDRIGVAGESSGANIAAAVTLMERDRGDVGFAHQTLIVPVAGALLLTAFWNVERRVAQPLVSVEVLRRGTVRWGNLAGLLAFATETSVVFLLTLYLQKVLGYSPLGAGLSFAVLGAGTVVGGMVGPRVIGLVGTKNALVGGFALQAAATVPLVFLGQEPGWIALLLAATFGRRRGEPGRHRRIHAHRDVRTPRSRTRLGHRAGDHEPAGRDHDGHPDHVRDRHRTHQRAGRRNAAYRPQASAPRCS